MSSGLSLQRSTAAEAKDLAIVGETIRLAREAQVQWANWPIARRLKVLTRLRHLVVENADDVVAAIGTSRKSQSAEIVASEVLPFCDACKFLETTAETTLGTKKLRRRGRPLWLSGVDLELRREPFGIVLIIAPTNYQFFLPGTQALQALAAGNAVLVKPGTNGTATARVLLDIATAAGIPTGLLAVLPEHPAAAQEAIAIGVDKVVFTGSHASGTQVLRQLAEHATPAVMELSGCDAIFLLPGCDIKRAVKALAFSLRLNSSRTCMRPHRVLVHESLVTRFEAMLKSAFADLPSIELSADAQHTLRRMIHEALEQGADLASGRFYEDGRVQPFAVKNVKPQMQISDADLFAPVVVILPYTTREDAIAQYALGEYRLGASVFGPAAEAASFASQVDAGFVTINDVIVPTADPRLPFSGRGKSGFGATRGAEGLLEMTRIKAVAVRRSRFLPHLEAPQERDDALLLGALRGMHSATLTNRLRGSIDAFKAAISKPPKSTEQI